MSNDKKSDVLDLKLLEILLHFEELPNNTDLNCPYHTWIGDDLLYSNAGEWKCHLKKYYYASDQYGLDSVDYSPCNVKDYKKCELYQNNGRK